MSLITVERSFTSSENSLDNFLINSQDHDGSSSIASNEDFVVSKTSVVSVNRFSRRPSTGRILTHLQTHLNQIMRLLRPQDSLSIIVSLQCSDASFGFHKYLCIVSTLSENDNEEAIILGVDVNMMNKVSVGLTIPIYQNFTLIPDGDGGFKLTDNKIERLFKPTSVQALWKVFQELQRCLSDARSHSYHSNGLNHTWIEHYENLPRSDATKMQEWLKMDDIENFGQLGSTQSDNENGEKKRNLQLIRNKLREIMSCVDLEEITVYGLRMQVEDALKMDLHAYRHFIEDMVLQIYGQMDQASTICEHLLLGSTFNASNRHELETRNVTHILNVTREVDNFFPGDRFMYKNIREFDTDETNLLAYWEDTHKFINLAKENGTRCLVHCKMGVSRSASTVIAYLMKEYHWNVEKAYEFVRSKRNCIKPNDGFLRQLHIYNGILVASFNRTMFEKENFNVNGQAATRVDSSENYISSHATENDTEFCTSSRKNSLPLLSDNHSGSSLNFELIRDSHNEILFKNPTSPNKNEVQESINLRPTSVGNRLRPDNSWIIQDGENEINFSEQNVETPSEDDISSVVSPQDQSSSNQISVK